MRLMDAPAARSRAASFDDEPALGTAIARALWLNALLRRKVTGNLDQVLTAAEGTLLARFAAGLCRGFAAISAALELPWTTQFRRGGDQVASRC
jgi:transposase